MRYMKEETVIARIYGAVEPVPQQLYLAPGVKTFYFLTIVWASVVITDKINHQCITVCTYLLLYVDFLAETLKFLAQ